MCRCPPSSRATPSQKACPWPQSMRHQTPCPTRRRLAPRAEWFAGRWHRRHRTDTRIHGAACPNSAAKRTRDQASCRAEGGIVPGCVTFWARARFPFRMGPTTDMRLRMRCLFLACFLSFPLADTLPAQTSDAATGSQGEASKGNDNPAKQKDIAAFTKDMQHLPGFVDMHVDKKTDRVYLQLSRFGEELLYATAQASGLGSNPIGLDRGSLGPQHVIEFRRAGQKVLVMAKNLRFRALSDNARERLAVAESFAPSVIGSLPVKAETGGAVLVDATAFFIRDATNAARKLGGSGSSYKVDKERSALWLARTKAFPDNSEVEVLLTFTSSKPNREVGRTANSQAVSLRQHHSFIRLPDANYKPRAFDPRIGFSGPQFQDYAAPIGESMHRHLIARHRLEKKDP
ncbi:MAG TPA: DUF5117 domain-containing protein, partial [Planctomycetes bacterium]|nr:DUF5117 domain-containing protein [Planctomycetota bacterium]